MDHLGLEEVLVIRLLLGLLPGAPRFLWLVLRRFWCWGFVWHRKAYHKPSRTYDCGCKVSEYCSRCDLWLDVDHCWQHGYHGY